MLSLARSKFSAHAVLIALSLVSSGACSEELDPVADAESDTREGARSGDVASETVVGTQPAAPADEGGQPEGQPGTPDAAIESAGLPSCGHGEDGVFVARVVDPGQSSQPVAGVSTIVVDDATGLPILPSIQAISSREGCVRLAIGSLARFGIKALGNSAYTDSYTFHFDAAEPLIRVGSGAFASLFPMLARYESRQDSAPVVGTVYWKTSVMQSYDVIGCAQIQADNDELVQQELRYFAASLPSPIAEWPHARGTNPSNGRFFVGNMLPGAHTLTARLPNGTVIGSTQIVTFPRSQASTQVDGRGENLFFAPIYIDAPSGATKPGCTP